MQGSYGEQLIGIVLDQVVNGQIQLQQVIDGITVQQTNLKNGDAVVNRWASRDNRSLWVIKELEGIGIINVAQQFRIGIIPEKRKTTKNGGEKVFVRNGKVGGEKAINFPFWSNFSDLDDEDKTAALENFARARIENGYFLEDLSPGENSDDEFDVTRQWFLDTSRDEGFRFA